MPTDALSPRPNRPDDLTALVTGIRWATITLSLVWAILVGTTPIVLAIGGALAAYSLFRTLRPINYRKSGWRSLSAIIVELVICIAAVVATGCWGSSYIFLLFTPVIAGGFAQGFWHAFRIAATAVAAITVAAFLLDQMDEFENLYPWTAELLLTVAVSSYARHLVAKARQAEALNLSQLWRLNEANTLLMNLTQLSHDLPVSFDFDETAQGALDRVKDAVNPDFVALLLTEPGWAHWSVVNAEGGRLPDSYPLNGLPAGLRDVAQAAHPQVVRDLSAEKPGLMAGSRSGMYAPLWAGPRQVGLVAIEAEKLDHFGGEELGLIAGLAEPMALTIDNARWFERLRARGAAQERSRIARDLHDRIGQGIAYVAFELDRLAAHAAGTEVEAELNQLRDDARFMVRELRETLYDLRTDVTDEHGIDETVRQFLARVQTRSGIETSYESTAPWRLPLHQESEVWRITQEAVVNAERHSHARHIVVNWSLDKGTGVLTVRDDGVGVTVGADGTFNFAESSSPGRSSYGVTGMRERAEGLGATLDIVPDSPHGTCVRLTLSVAGHKWPTAVRPGLSSKIRRNENDERRRG